MANWEVKVRICPFGTFAHVWPEKDTNQQKALQQAIVQKFL